MEIIYYPILDTSRPRAQALQQQIESGLYDALITDDESKANAYLVGGGDGFMLDTIKRKYDFTRSPEDNKPFFGINCGTLGFLLNDISSLDGLPRNQEMWETVKAHMMQADITKADGSQETRFALNDIVIGGNILDYYKFTIASKQLSKRFHGTGVMISTALGSSAYRLNNGGPIMPVESTLRGVSGLASLPFGYSIIRPQPLEISIKGRSAAMVGVDGYSGKIQDIERIMMHPTQHYATLAFAKSTSFDSKRMLLAEQKLLRDDA